MAVFLAKVVGNRRGETPIPASRTANGQYYDGRAGGISEKKTRIKITGSSVGNPPETTFLQSYSYDPLGNMASLTYPADVSLNAAVPRRRVDLRYEDGRLTSVLPYYATGIAYHYNGLIHRVSTGKRAVKLETGQRWEQAIDPSTGMARPARIGTVGVTLSGTGAAGDWSTGSYSWDGAGNITTMGSESYSYDKVSRLVSTTRAGGENYTYDPFGNLTAMNGFWRTTDPATNRLTEAAYDLRGNLLARGGEPSPGIH